MSSTRIVPISAEVLGSPALARRLAVRQLSVDAWIDAHASGTLRKNKRLGCTFLEQYRHERAAFEFGWPFECYPRSRVMYGDAYTMGDCKPITEAGWHLDRLITLWPFPEDLWDVKYVAITDGHGTTEREGIGAVLRQTSAEWVPAGFLVAGIVAEYDKVRDVWLEAVPC